jgi:hypothetical protein
MAEVVYFPRPSNTEKKLPIQGVLMMLLSTRSFRLAVRLCAVGTVISSCMFWMAAAAYGKTDNVERRIHELKDKRWEARQPSGDSDLKEFL